MKNSFAVLIDGGHFSKSFGAPAKGKKEVRRELTAEDLQAFCEDLYRNEFLKDRSLLRTYYYDARPLSRKMKHPISGEIVDFTQTEVFRSRTAFLQGVEVLPFFSLREGETVARGWSLKNRKLDEIVTNNRTVQESDLAPSISQKGVDLRIGLDIARLSLRQLVDCIVLVAADSDLLPAMKFARREGIQVFLVDLGRAIRPEMKIHADVVIDMDCRPAPDPPLIEAP